MQNKRARPLSRDKSFAFVITPDFDVFVSSEDILNAYHNDKVLVKVFQQRNRKKYGIITKVLERANKTVVGTVVKYKTKYLLEPDNLKLHTDFFIRKIGEAVSGDKVIIKISDWGNGQKLPSGDVIEILGKAGVPEVETLSIIKQFDLPLFFPEEAIREAENISEEISSEELAKREDFRALTTFTIDPASAKDYDDAVSLEKTTNGFRLYVHIADVAHYISQNSELFKEAMKRGNSYYFPKRVLPMLPEKISNKICSLRPFEEKLAISVITEFDQNMHILEQKAVESIIKSDARLSYEEVDKLFENSPNEIPKEIAEILFQMRNFSSLLSEKRKKKGYLHFDLPETKFIFDENGHLIDLKREVETESHTLIENFMLIANEYIANLLASHPTIFRIHEKPDENDLENIRRLAEKYRLNFNIKNNLNKAFQDLLASIPGDEYHHILDRFILRNLKKARYDIKNKGHFGLAIKKYTHFTSPIRRLCDLAIHRQVKDFIEKRQSSFSRKELAKIAEIASEKEQLADEVERETEFRNKLLFMKKKIGEEFSGIIISIKSSVMIVELNKYPVSGIVELTMLKDDYYEFWEREGILIGKRNHKIFKVLDKVKVMVTRVTNDVYLQVI
ncbi:MAG: ribonuclease R [Candidatus Cloacimonas sp. 4484_275]|nr:MAG: ribonuclease R [Candidatus Cloacimonas sp. 4484_275]